jgi:hypothetical protein
MILKRSKELMNDHSCENFRKPVEQRFSNFAASLLTGCPTTLAALTLIILFSEILKLILIKIKIEGNY